jgi:hypothetical protein
VKDDLVKRFEEELKRRNITTKGVKDDLVKRFEEAICDDDEKCQNLNDRVAKGAVNDSNEDHGEIYKEFDEIYEIVVR